MTDKAAPTQNQNTVISTLSSDGMKQLTQADVLRLISERSEAIRGDIADKITYQLDSGSLSPTELDLAEHIIRFLTYQAEVSVRKIVAHNLKDSDKLPHDIALKLAKDVEEVALPILESSNILTSLDLIDIIKKTDEPKRSLAISRRKDVPEPVSDALVDTQNEDIVDSLLHNDGARIPDRSYKKIIVNFTDSQRVAEAVMQRKSVPPHLSAKLMSSVSSKLSSYLQKKYNVVAPEIAEVVEQSREIVTLNLLKANASREEAMDFVSRLNNTNQLTPSIIVMSLCMNKLEFFAVAMATKACIPAPNATTLIQDVDGLGFQSLYKKTALPERLKQPISVLLRSALILNGSKDTASLTLQQYTNRLLEHVQMYAAEEPVENLPYILGLIHRITTSPISQPQG
jgi:uncharacterized protein (DUF2336 family)